MTRWRLQQWAISTVEGMVDSESAQVASKDGGFHLPSKKATWDFMHTLSMGHVLSSFERRGPTLLRLLAAAAIPASRRLEPSPMGIPPYRTYLSKPIEEGTGKNHQNPVIVILVAYMLLMAARNLRFTAFQKLVGVWLFAHTAQHGVYGVLSRIGLSVSYTSVLNLLRKLGGAARDTIRKGAIARAFILIYDNINRRFRAWDPDLGQTDIMHNGTAATYIEMEDCDVERAFDPEPLRLKREQESRRALTRRARSGAVFR
ncbi:hypothetical protein FA95DRAFT_1596845, partial [Auriscalpium vulgare]